MDPKSITFESWLDAILQIVKENGTKTVYRDLSGRSAYIGHAPGEDAVNVARTCTNYGEAQAFDNSGNPVMNDNGTLKMEYVYSCLIGRIPGEFGIPASKVAQDVDYRYGSADGYVENLMGAGLISFASSLDREMSIGFSVLVQGKQDQGWYWGAAVTHASMSMLMGMKNGLYDGDEMTGKRREALMRRLAGIENSLGSFRD